MQAYQAKQAKQAAANKAATSSSKQQEATSLLPSLLGSQTVSLVVAPIHGIGLTCRTTRFVAAKAVHCIRIRTRTD